ncbi:MAG: ester cyclase [Saprospiraceae bacterium]|nr:ester cyclase [Saprospiraceae bacterium]
MKSTTLFTLALLSTALSAPLAANNMTYPAPTDVVKQYYAAVDAGKADELAKLLADDCTITTPLAPAPMPKQAWLGVVQAMKGAFPDMLHDVAAYIESGSTVVARGALKGQNNGSYMGNPPTGNRVNVPFNVVFELDKSWKIRAIYGQFDMKTLESQLMAGLNGPAAADEAKIRAAYDALNRKDWNTFASLCDEKKYRDVGVAPEPLVGLQAALEGYKQFFSAFPDMNIAVNEVAPLGKGRYLLRVTLTGTNTGSLMGIPPTGKRMNYDDVDLVELDAAGKIIYHQPTKGGPEVFRQIGVEPGMVAKK